MNEIVFVLYWRERLPKSNCTVVGGGEFDVCAGQVLGSRKERQVLDCGGQDHLFGFGVAHQDVVDGVAVVVPSNTEAGGGICLRIAIDQKDLETFQGEACGKIDSGGRFAHSALLIDHAENLSHGISG